MNAPNLFRYAKKELSQDAVICWLIDWSAHDGDSELSRLGRRFVETLLHHKQQDRKVNLGGRRSERGNPTAGEAHRRVGTH